MEQHHIFEHFLLVERCVLRWLWLLCAHRGNIRSVFLLSKRKLPAKVGLCTPVGRGQGQQRLRGGRKPRAGAWTPKRTQKSSSSHLGQTLFTIKQFFFIECNFQEFKHTKMQRECSQFWSPQLEIETFISRKIINI
ncbi:hypothetical protein HJG60_008425 [Phyllostomus discolor]|uniref:Uncharacterized protein n=1 Tax=Phyllostomus discolor TaxID=89673 RepID=A0A834DJP9_9CHIR|nr:hypothetical protein HJG60_008425 [Phyllostomus discolor]